MMTQHSNVSQTFKKFSFSKFGENIEVITIYVTRVSSQLVSSIQRGGNFTIILGSKIDFVEICVRPRWDSIQFAFIFAVL